MDIKTHFIRLFLITISFLAPIKCIFGLTNGLYQSGSGFLVFHDFRIASEDYSIYLNDGLISHVLNDRFALRTNLASGTEYHVLIKKTDDESVVLDESFTLKSEETKIITYTAYGIVHVSPLWNGSQWDNYTYFIDLDQIEPGTQTNLWAGFHYILKVVNKLSNIIYTAGFELKDGEIKELRPELDAKTGFHIKLFKTDETYAGLGLDYLITRYLWAGIGCGVSGYNGLASQTYCIFFPNADIGYYLYGDMTTLARAGLGLTFHGYFTAPVDPNAAQNNVLIGNFYGVGIFIQAESLIFYIKPAVYYDLSQFHFDIALGVKF